MAVAPEAQVLVLEAVVLEPVKAQPVRVPHVERTLLDVVFVIVPEVDTPNVVVVAQYSAVSVVHLSGPSVGSGGKVGDLFGPILSRALACYT